MMYFTYILECADKSLYVDCTNNLGRRLDQHNHSPHWIALDFKVQIDRQKVVNGEPHKFDAIDWFTLKTLPQPLHSQSPHFLSLYKSKLKDL